MLVMVMPLGLAAPLAAQQAVPDFGPCRDGAVERLERELRRHLESPFAEQVPTADMAGIAYCADVAIFICDQGDAVDTCHNALTEVQQGLRADLLASLPAPQVVAGRRGMWSDTLYPRMVDLAHGHSAGPDCAGVAVGDGPRCAVRAANRQVQIALRAWVLARYLGAVPSAVEAGWANPAAPTRPRARQ